MHFNDSIVISHTHNATPCNAHIPTNKHVEHTNGTSDASELTNFVCRGFKMDLVDLDTFVGGDDDASVARSTTC